MARKSLAQLPRWVRCAQVFAFSYARWSLVEYMIAQSSSPPLKPTHLTHLLRLQLFLHRLPSTLWDIFEALLLLHAQHSSALILTLIFIWKSISLSFWVLWFGWTWLHLLGSEVLHDINLTDKPSPSVWQQELIHGWALYQSYSNKRTCQESFAGVLMKSALCHHCYSGGIA